MTIVVSRSNEVSEKNFFEDFRESIEYYIRFLYFESPSDAGAKFSSTKKLIHDALEYILNKTDEYSALGRMTIHYTGGQFRGLIESKNTSDDGFRSILIFLSRVFREHSVKTGVIPNKPASDVLDYFSESNTALTFEEKQNVDYIWNRLPVNLTEQTLALINEEKKQTAEAIQVWKNQLSELEARVQREASNLKKQQQHYNFVGLSSAFKELLDKKKTARNLLFAFLCLSGASLILPPAYFYLWHGHSQPKAWMDYITEVLPFAAIDLILLYFFRIFLQNFYSAKAQILQLELRYSLCAFIESYVDFIKEKDNGKQGERKLEKFEALIFSGLSPDINNVPSTFDGLEQLTKIIKELK